MSLNCYDLKASERIRNICILAHVDHGKTTLVDNLISSNKIISNKNVGKVKYLDNREDEQKRQITMKSSSILLTHHYNPDHRNQFLVTDTPTEQNDKKNITNERNEKIQMEDETYMINIIDTPGHVDFSSEVSTCIRICDGALILIDCIEGMCSQTKIVLRQTWKEMLKTILVINKIDKLITNKNMDSVSAYEHINNIIEQVNAYIYQLYIEENMNEDNIQISDLEEYTYSPIKGNVLLCSSIHCWCIDMHLFALLFCKKVNISPDNADKIQKDDEQIKNICSELHISDACLNANQQQNARNNQKIWDYNTSILISILSTFLNLSRSIFQACIKIFPSPKNINPNRLFKIYPSLYNKEIYKDIIQCATNDFTIIYISKYVCANIQSNILVSFKGYSEKNTFLAICKIYAGTLHKDSILYLPSQNIQTTVNKIFICMGGDLIPIQTAYAGNIVALYLTIVKDQWEKEKERKRERELTTDNNENNQDKKNIQCINDNCVKAAGNLNKGDMQSLSNTLMNLIKNKRSKKEYNIFFMNNEIIFLNKNVTLSNKKNIDSFILPFTDTCSTILHSIIEPKNIQDMSKFLYGLILLYTYDTSIDIDFNDKGEYVLKFCGEIHMQKCLSDFVNIYSNIDIKTSDVSISIREGINENNAKIKRKKNKMTSQLKNLYGLYMQTQNQVIVAEQKCSDILEENKENVNENGKIDIKMINENKNVFAKQFSDIEMNEGKQLEHTFKHIKIEKDNQFLDTLFNYNHNIIFSKLNNNLFYLFLSVLNMPNQILHFFDKHYSDIQMLLENRSVSPFFLFYNKEKFSNANEDLLYKQCLINLEKCVNELCFKNKDVDNNNEKREHITTAAANDTTSSNGWNDTNKTTEMFAEINKTIEEGNVGTKEKMNYLKKNKTHDLQLWDISIHNGSITLLFMKKYYNKKKNGEFVLDNILTNKKYKDLISQRNFVDAFISDANDDVSIYMNNLCLGYKLASKYGPIAQEPIRGVMFIIEGLIIDEPENDEGAETFMETVSNNDVTKTIHDQVNSDGENNTEEKINAGNIIVLMKEACANAMQQNKLRIYEPMLRLNLTCECNVLGKVYNVLLKRRCAILSEEMKEGYFLYCIDAYLPLFNSFKLAEELRSKCSGNVIYDIQFSHWNKLNEDIFLTNDTSTVVYDEDFDVKLTDNDATDIVNYIRKAKGLVTYEKIISKPEKQCTLKK